MDGTGEASLGGGGPDSLGLHPSLHPSIPVPKLVKMLLAPGGGAQARQVLSGPPSHPAGLSPRQPRPRDGGGGGGAGVGRAGAGRAGGAGAVRAEAAAGAAGALGVLALACIGARCAAPGFQSLAMDAQKVSWGVQAGGGRGWAWCPRGWEVGSRLRRPPPGPGPGLAAAVEEDEASGPLLPGCGGPRPVTQTGPGPTLGCRPCLAPGET